MGVFSTNRPYITPGALISSSYISNIYDVLTGQITENIVISGSFVVTGSSIVTGGITSSLFGTSSWAVTASHALNAKTASYATNALTAATATFAATASVVNYITSSSIATSATSASYAATASYIASTEYLIIPISDEINSLTTGSSKVTFYWPYSGTLLDVRATLSTTASTQPVIVDININDSSILSTKLSIDVGEYTSVTAATASVISNSTIVDNSKCTIDIDQVGISNTGKGLKVHFKTLVQ